MGIHLTKIEISTFRGVDKYIVDNLGMWSSITGRNSTSKSSIIDAISFLCSNRMHEFSDIPSIFEPAKVNLKNVEIEINYLFKLNKNFDELMDDEKIIETLVLIYNNQLSNLPEVSDYRPYLEKALHSLNTEKPLSNILKKSLYEAIRCDIEQFPDHPPYKPIFNSNGFHKMPEQIFKETQFLKVILKLSHSDGADFKFYLLDKNKEIIVSDEVFYHWLQNQDAIDSEITLAYVIGAVFIKSVTSSLCRKTEIWVPPTILAPDGSNLKQYIEYCLVYNPKIFEKTSHYFRSVFDYEVFLKKRTIGSEFKNELVIKLGESGEWFPFDNLSNGMFNLLKILLQIASSRNGDIILIDEPELHLHPGAKKRLRDILFERKDNTQIITVTHSPIFLDTSFVDTIILHQNIENSIKPQILNSNKIDLALSELGSSGLDALLYDVVIWVEGPSDKIYLERWLDLLKKDSDVLLSSQIGILPYGGKSNLLHHKVEELKMINRKSIFIIDSDNKSENETIDPNLNRFISQCNDNDIHCWVTERREIENYIPIEIFNKVLRIPPNMLFISKYDDVFEKLKQMGRNYENDKVKLAKELAPFITINHIKEDSKFYDELEKLFNYLI